MKKETRERYEEMIRDIVNITRDCRDDMHEPDEQGITGFVFGRTFDNAVIATKDDVVALAAGDKRNVDMTLALFRDMPDNFETGVYNMADLIAIIRMLNADRKQ